MLLKLISLLGPMALLIGLGYLCRRKNTFSPEEIGGLKKLVARVLLPFLVFTSFATVELEVRTLLLPLLSALIFLGAFGMGKLCRTLPGIYGEYHPFVAGSTEAGMVGYGLFAMLFGKESLPYFVIFDAGQSLIFFTVYLPALRRFTEGKRTFQLRSLLKDPLLLSMLLGLAANVTGLWQLLYASPAGPAAEDILAVLSAPVSCIMLFAVGYGLQPDRDTLKPVCRSALLRIGYMLPMSLGLMALIRHLGMDVRYVWGALLFFALPPSYLLSAYVREERPQHYVNTFLSLYVLYTLAVALSIALFAV